MRRSFVILVFLVCFQFLIPTPAHAWWRWVDELSGPGSFNGVSIPVRLWCLPGKSATLTLNTRKRVGYALAALGGSGCLFRPGIVPRASLLKIGTAWLVPRHNPLHYDSPQDVHLDLRLLLVELMASVHVDPNLDRDLLELGFGVGVLMMSGPAFDSFTRVFIEPIRADFRPFGWAGRAGVIVLRGSIMVVPQGFDANDFGATPGSFHVSREVLPTFGIFFDVLRLR